MVPDCSSSLWVGSSLSGVDHLRVQGCGFRDTWFAFDEVEVLEGWLAEGVDLPQLLSPEPEAPHRPEVAP